MTDKPDVTTRAAILAIILGIAIMVGLVVALHFIEKAQAAWQNVAQEWAPYRLNEGQRDWFKSIRAPNGVPCCDISDGHPTEMQHRLDGIYITDPIHLGEPRQWIKVPDEAVVKGASNPVGVATVWYVPQGSDTVYIRCFVPESDV